MTRKSQALDLIRKLAAQERAAAGTEFVAPLAGDQDVVAVRVAGTICRVRNLHGIPAGFRGFAILRILDTRNAEFVAEASLSQKEEYLALLRPVRMVLAHAGEDNGWLATPLHTGSQAIRLAGVVPVRLTEDGLQVFDAIVARTDGGRFWHERRDSRHDMQNAERLRAALLEQIPPERLSIPGLTPGERAAYGVAANWEKAVSIRSVEDRVAAALAHAGAKLVDIAHRDDLLVVRFDVDGDERTALIRPDDLTSESAGFCLSGRDQDFDLSSLVSVYRGGVERGAIHNTGLPWEFDDEDDWDD